MNFPNELFVSTKEHFQNVHNKITNLWGKPEMDRELEVLLDQEFPPAVHKELIDAYIVHKDHFAFLPA